MQKPKIQYNSDVKFFKLMPILFITAIFVSSCSGIGTVDDLGEELSIREAELQKGIETKAENCELVWLLETYATWGQMELYSIGPTEAAEIANKLKNYTQQVYNLSKSDPYLDPEYFNDLSFIIEKIDSEDLAERFYAQLGRTYFPDCGYFSIDSDSLGTQNQVPQPQVTKESKGNREACRIYYETYDEAMQLPFGSPKLAYILKNGYAKAMGYADADLALNLQILIDGKPGSSQVIFDVNEICGQYR
jgi:hypothetical protein